MARVLIAVGLGFGDEGKGGVVEALVRKTEASTVVRFNGGAQCAHNVVLADGRHHTFAQFGSGTFAGARTFLSQFMLVNPSALLNEARHIEELGIADPLDRMFIDGHALVTTPFHVAANRIREEHRGAGRHGSCGMGIGETVSDWHVGMQARVRDLSAPFLTDLLDTLRKFQIAKLEQDGIPRGDSPTWHFLLYADPAATAERWQELVRRAHIVDTEWLHEALSTGVTVFEGAQGVLLDQDFGFHPYTTWSNTRFDNAMKLLKWAGFEGDVTRIGVTRTYLTRHGPGPFPTFDPDFRPSEQHNAFNQWQREFRAGALDYVLLQYALDVCGGVDDLAVTHADVLAPPPCIEYTSSTGTLLCLPVSIWAFSPGAQMAWQERRARELAEMRPVYATARATPDHIGEWLKIPVTLTSYGPSAADKRWSKP